ncbi:uracil-DNA glycosylase [Zwartia sp.]|uniref:uracil-DNA glycosylase n=1 Tax=Zwartia sp. TaxID=2978004 RepID=UPI003BB16E50
MTTQQTNAPQYSALQLAWLQELGIEKPWLPSEQVTSKILSVPVSVATVDVPVPTVEAMVAPIRPIAPRPSGAPSARAAASAAPTPAPEVQIDTQALANAASDMAALADIISACQACGLCRERQQAVTGEGVMQPAIMVVGEAPGDYEDRQGRPFVDRPGLMLDNMLSAIQSSRTQNVYVSNIVKCRPPGNRNPKPPELAACKPYLMRQIELVRPFSILAVGRAAQALLETDEPLEKLRQVTHSLVVAGQKIPLIVTSHPVRLLNHPAEKAAVWQDLLLVKTVSGL